MTKLKKKLKPERIQKKTLNIAALEVGMRRYGALDVVVVEKGLLI